MAIFNSKIITCVEISDGYIKLIQISSKAEASKVTTCAFKEFSPSEPEAGLKAFQEVLREHNIRPKELILSIPRQLVTTKNLRLPSQNPQEIDEMAGFQAVKQIPYSKEDILYGFNLIEVDSEGYSKVLLVICHKDVVDKPLDILTRAGLMPLKVTLSSFGILNWLNLNEELKQYSETSPVAVIDCDSLTSDIVIGYKGKLVYTRGLTFGVSEGGAYSQRLIDEIDRSFSMYEKESEMPRPTEAIFTGMISELTRSKEEIGRSLNMKVSFLGSFENVPSELAPQSQPFTALASFSSLIGAPGQEAVDLLPKAIKTTTTMRTKKRQLVMSLVLLSIIILVLSSLVWNKMHQKQLLLKVLELRLKDTSPVASEAERMRAATEIIRSQLKKKTEALDVLNELHKIVPPQIYLALYTYDNEKVELKGTSEVLSDVFKLVTILENSPYFQNVEVRYATKRKISNQEFVDFEISCPLSRNAKGGR